MPMPTVFSAVKEGWTYEDWMMMCAEMAAFLEYEQHNPRGIAEQKAKVQMIVRYGRCPPK